MKPTFEPNPTELSLFLRDRVSRGARLLDQVNPGWHRRIDLDQLAMETCNRDILGQLHGDYLVGYRAVLKTLPSHTRYSSSEHGFTLSEALQELGPDEGRIFDVMGLIPRRIKLRFETLGDLWRGQVLDRREADR